MDKIKLDYSRQLIKEAANCLNTPLNNINSHIDCLEENTQVLLAHRLLMPIKSIKIGESVATSDGGSAKVQNCWKGNERELIEIRFDGASVRLTANHPVQTPNGFVKAESLKAGDEVSVFANEQNAIQKVKSVEKSNRCLRFATLIRRAINRLL